MYFFPLEKTTTTQFGNLFSGLQRLFIFGLVSCQSFYSHAPQHHITSVEINRYNTEL